MSGEAMGLGLGVPLQECRRSGVPLEFCLLLQVDAVTIS